jgi:hypothetical protein
MEYSCRSQRWYVDLGKQDANTVDEDTHSVDASLTER